MKIFSVLASLLMLLSGCSYSSYELAEPIGSPSTSYEESELWRPEGRISRTNDYDSRLTGIVVIDDAKEYCEYFGSTNAVYSEEYFAENALIACSITESSGSIGLEYIGIDADNNIIIKRTVPEVGTCDMAEYTLTIDIPQSRAADEYSIIYDTTFNY